MLQMNAQGSRVSWQPPANAGNAIITYRTSIIFEHGQGMWGYFPLYGNNGNGQAEIPDTYVELTTVNFNTFPPQARAVFAVHAVDATGTSLDTGEIDITYLARRGQQQQNPPPGNPQNQRGGNQQQNQPPTIKHKPTMVKIDDQGVITFISPLANIQVYLSIDAIAGTGGGFTSIVPITPVTATVSQASGSLINDMSIDTKPLASLPNAYNAYRFCIGLGDSQGNPPKQNDMVPAAQPPAPAPAPQPAPPPTPPRTPTIVPRNPGVTTPTATSWIKTGLKIGGALLICGGIVWFWWYIKHPGSSAQIIPAPEYGDVAQPTQPTPKADTAPVINLENVTNNGNITQNIFTEEQSSAGVKAGWPHGYKPSAHLKIEDHIDKNGVVPLCDTLSPGEDKVYQYPPSPPGYCWKINIKTEGGPKPALYAYNISRPKTAQWVSQEEGQNKVGSGCWIYNPNKNDPVKVTIIPTLIALPD